MTVEPDWPQLAKDRCAACGFEGLLDPGRRPGHAGHHRLAAEALASARARGAEPRRVQVTTLLQARWLNGPADDRERTSLESFGEALARLERPFDEEADPTHVTSSALVLGPEGVLLHLHKRLGLWLQPGGHLEPGEALAEGARREAGEESGLEVTHPPGGPWPVHVDVHQGGRGHTHLDLRWVLRASGPPRPPAGESPDVRWCTWDEALAMADPGLRGLLLARRGQLTQGAS